MHRITPFVKRMRTNGGTIYTFSSSVEDIGLNINERNNIVKISHFALLNIPQINEPQNIEENRFNVNAIPGAFEYNQGSPNIKDGRVLIAESFQNYALNLEANLLNREDYEPTLVRTVTERVFWKWLKETGAVRWIPDVSASGTQYWSEPVDADGSLGYNSVVKYIGLVSAGNSRTDTFGTYNETYVLVPTSHGQTDAYFQVIEDDNYYHGMEIEPTAPNENILGRAGYTLPHPDGLDYRAYYDMMDSSTHITANGNIWNTYYDLSTGSWTPGWWYSADGRDPGYGGSVDNVYLTDTSAYMSDKVYHTDLRYQDGVLNTVDFRRSRVDCISLVTDLDKLKLIYSDTALTYDKMAIQYAINDNFDFNTILLYYTVYNSTMDQVLGVNLLGVLFIDAPNGNSSNIGFDGITIPSIEKIQTSAGGFGTSYSFRLNIKTDTMVDDTQLPIVDKSTSDQVYAEDWAASFANLDKAVQILQKNNGTISYISAQYIDVRATQTQILNDLQALQFQVNDIGRDIMGETNSLAMFADGDDPLVDSSVYMRFGNVGVKIKEPKYPLHVSGTTKADDIIIEKSIKDVSGNILLGYGSPLQLGASTNYRKVNIYTGDSTPATSIDASGITINRDLSLNGNFELNGSGEINGTLTVTQLESPNFDFNTSYIRHTSNGSTLSWINGFLEASISSTASAAGPIGSLQFKNNAGVLNGMTQLNWSSSDYTLRVTGIGDFRNSNHSLIPLYVYKEGSQITSDRSIYDIGAMVNITNDYAIATEITDSGYRMGVNIAAHSNDSDFKGILAKQYGLRVQYGHDTNSGNGKISKAYGIKLDYLSSGTAIVDTKYSIYSTGDAILYNEGVIKSGVSTGDILRFSNDLPFIRRTTSKGGMAIGTDDSVIIGAGEARAIMESKVPLSTEDIYLGADGGINLYSNISGWSSRYTARFDTAGVFTAPRFSGANVTSGADPGHTHALTGSYLTGTLPVNKGGTGLTSGYNKANWDAAYTHVSSTGADHSYINQSITTSASPTFAGITITGNESLTGALYLNSTNIPSGTPSGTEYLFMDTSDSNRVKRVAITAVQWSGSTANGVGTYNDSGTIVSEPNLTFDGTWLDVTGHIELQPGASRTIRVGAATGIAGNSLSIYSGEGGTTGPGLSGGTLNLYGGDGGNATAGDGGTGGSTFISGGIGGDYSGSTYAGGPGGDLILQGGSGGYGYTNGAGGNVHIYGGIGVPHGNVYLGLTSGETAVGRIYANLIASSQSYKVVYNISSHLLSYELDSTSDERVKKDFVKLSGAEILENLDKINGYTFQYNELAAGIGFTDTSTRQVGLIAQEVEKVFPEVVSENLYPDPYVMETVKQIKYDRMVAYLVESIKELKSIVKSQQEEIEKLKNQ